MKLIYIMLGIVMVSLFSGCQSSDDRLDEQINSITKPMNKELRKCLYNYGNTWRIDPSYYNKNFYIMGVGHQYDNCRIKSNLVNITIANITSSCNEIKTFIEIDHFPKIKRVCYTTKYFDIITNETTYKYNVCPERHSLPDNCGKGCTMGGQSNYFQKGEFKEHYLNNCILENAEATNE